MGGRFLLDTNVVIALFAGDERIEKLLRDADHVLVPSIVLGELYFGAYNSRMKEENIRRINEFAGVCPVIGPTTGTAIEYGRIKNKLKRSGTPIPENDIWIAALASQFDFQIVTSDAHFDKIKGIALKKIQIITLLWKNLTTIHLTNRGKNSPASKLPYS